MSYLSTSTASHLTRRRHRIVDCYQTAPTRTRTTSFLSGQLLNGTNTNSATQPNILTPQVQTAYYIIIIGFAGYTFHTVNTVRVVSVRIVVILGLSVLQNFEFTLVKFLQSSNEASAIKEILGIGFNQFVQGPF